MIVRHRKGYTLTFDPQTHRYTLENNGETRVLPSVTRVLSVLAKPRVNTWAMVSMAQHILDNYYPGMSTEEMILLLQEALRGDFDFPPEEVAAPTVAVLFPKRESPEAVLARLEASGFRVAPGIGPTAGKAVRVGLFGSQAEAVQDLVEALLGVGA